jgi:tetratricopeptide (TPR) repeat protein
MLEGIVERLKQGKFLESDVPALVEALSRGEVVASAAGAVAADGDIVNSQVTTFVFQGGQGTKVEIPEALLAKLEEALRRSLPPVLHNLPPIAAAFTGRGREEEEIVSALAGKGGSAAISALKGIGGVGKTALAIKIGYRLTIYFPDAQLLIDLRGTSEAPMSPRAAMVSVIRRFHPEGQLPDDDAAVLEIYRDLLHRKKVFLILDNAKDTAQVEKLLPPSPSAAIVTSRQVLHLAGARSIRLDDLPLPDATALVMKLLDGERSLTEAELGRLAQECCHCHPLSLRVAALFLKGHQGRGVSDYIASVEKDRTRLKLQGLPDHDVLAVIGQSVDQLQAEDEALSANWRDLSVFPSGFDTAAAAAVWSIDDRDIGSDRLSDLDRRGLIEVVAEDRYRLHDLLRDVARRDWPAERTQAAAQRHAEYFRSILDRANALYLQGGGAIAEGLALYDRERTNIEAGQCWAATECERSENAAILTTAYANDGVNIVRIRLHPRDWIRWNEISLEGCRRIGDRGGEGFSLRNLGIARDRLGESHNAIEYQKKALAIFCEIGERRGEGSALTNLGIAHRHLGEIRAAIEFHEKALAISRGIEDRRAEGEDFINLGDAYAELAKDDKSIEYTQKTIECFEKAVAILRQIGDRRGEGSALGGLGSTYLGLGETSKAVQYLEQRLTISREIGDRRSQGRAQDRLGLALKDSDPDAARVHWQAALAIYTAIEDPNAARMAQWLGELDRESAS